MNIATDVNITPSSLDRTTWTGLKKIAAEGSPEQQETLLAWSYSAVSAALSEELHFIVYGWDTDQYFGYKQAERQGAYSSSNPYDLDYSRALSQGAS